jgi:hypothetical protein
MHSSGNAWASFTAFEKRALGNPTVSCSSRGLLEQALLNAGHGESKNRPYVAMKADGPYALSPRLGDSLSLPMAEEPRVASPISLEACSWDALDQPYLAAKGEVSYAVDAEGIPDTTTLTVRSLHGVDTATFRSAARRLVASCRFSARPSGSEGTAGLVRQRFFFGAADALHYGRDQNREVSYGTPTDSVIARQIEDATLIHCPVLGPGLPPGRVEVQFVVGLDGKPDLPTIQAVNTTSAELARVAPSLVAGCRFTPARFKGHPVRSLIRLPLRVGADKPLR